jgi:alpha-glucosidase
MYFQKIRHPSNFSFVQHPNPGELQFGTHRMPLQMRDLGEDVFHVEWRDDQRWPLDPRLLPMLEQDFEGPSRYRLQLDTSGQLSLKTSTGESALAGSQTDQHATSLGVCGSAWLVQWQRHEGMRFYGQGEKVTGLEKTGKRTKFWNADVYADHAMSTIVEGQADPQYASVPYLLVRNGAHWVGILVDHPGAVFMDTGSNWFFSGHDDQNAPPSFWFGADQGVPAFYVIAGDNPTSVTQRLQRLVGKTPLPPLWALGHHQCRWGYQGTADLMRLDAAFTEHQFPCDGLWLDIDYMDRYKVFTTHPQHFGDRTTELKTLEDRGRKIVPILDPGIKVEAGYEIAASGLAHDIYCQNPEGQPYVGFVWPGRTWFPDYSLPEARQWWSDHVAQFRTWGFHGAWIDMNDPSVGAAELDDMLFQRGQWPHWTYHNLYATGMAQATHEGFLQARPNERPFVISRSAAAGSSRWTAVWTGDNWSNWHHLRTSLHGTLNLALSGIPFNGPDVPGFGGNADKALAIAWYKAGFLFPFLRNHSVEKSASQEPWDFGAEALEVIRHVVRLRYKLLPYLYQNWMAQADHGTPVLRPLFMDFDNPSDAEKGMVLDHVDDQFMVGPAIMQAPLLHAGQQRRMVVLPGDPQSRWWDACTGRFLHAAQVIQVTSTEASTPLYVREGQILPMQVGERTSPANDLSQLELHVFLGQGCDQEASLDYSADDGCSFAYQRGERSQLHVRARREGSTLRVQLSCPERGWQAFNLCIVAYDGIDRLVIDTPAGKIQQTPGPHGWRFTGGVLNAVMGQPITLA